MDKKQSFQALRHCCRPNAVVLGLVAIVAMVSAVGPAHAWKKEDRESGVTVYSRETPKSGSDTFKAVMVVKFAPARVRQILEETQHYLHFVPDLVEIRTLKEERTEDGRLISFVYQRLDLSTLDDRDYVVRAESKEMAGPDKRVRIEFEASRAITPPRRPDTIRVQKLKGYWELTPADGGAATHLVYVRHMELGGSVPDFMANSGLESSMMEMFHKLRSHCRKVLR